MGKRGPSKEPTAVKEAKGNPGRRPLNRDEPVPPSGPIEPPAWLQGHALEMWGEIAPGLIASKVLTTVDTPALALACDAYALYIECSKLLAEKGATYRVRSSTGRMISKPRPELAIAVDAYKRAKSMFQEFGLTPGSRSGIKVTPAGPEDKFGAWERRGKIIKMGKPS